MSLAARQSAPPLRIRGASGLGDALYLQAIVRHWALRGRRVTALCDWPDVFRALPHDRVDVQPFSRLTADIVAAYSLRRHDATDQFVDCCREAGIQEPVDLALDRMPATTRFLGDIQTPKRPVIAVALPREPFDRGDNFGLALLPDCRRIQRVIDRLDGRASFVLLGKGAALAKFRGIALDLANRTSVADLLDVAALCDGFLGYPSFFVPLAESYRAPGLFVWSRHGVSHAHPSIRAITPAKIIHRKDRCRAIFDDCSDPEINEAADAFFDAL